MRATARVALLGASLLAAALSARANGTGAPDRIELGRQVFTEIAQPSCTICHTLADAGAAGTVGPSLDALKPNVTRVLMAVRKGVGVMPPYGEKLSDAQIEAVAAYIARAAGKGR